MCPARAMPKGTRLAGSKRGRLCGAESGIKGHRPDVRTVAAELAANESEQDRIRVAPLRWVQDCGCSLAHEAVAEGAEGFAAWLGSNLTSRPISPARKGRHPCDVVHRLSFSLHRASYSPSMFGCTGWTPRLGKREQSLTARTARRPRGH